jgi:hypothetical protein
MNLSNAAAYGEPGAAYESETLHSLTVRLPDGTSRQFAGVRIVLLPGGALKVYRSRAFDDAVPFEDVFPHGGWSDYSAYPA